MRNESGSLRHAFDAYVKRSVRNAAMDYYTEKHKRLLTISTIEDCSCVLCYRDTYFMARYQFSIFGYEIIIENFELAEALLRIPNGLRVIILAYYFLELSDSSIGRQLGKPQRTVNYLRHKGLKLLREVMSCD